MILSDEKSRILQMVRDGKIFCCYIMLALESRESKDRAAGGDSFQHTQQGSTIQPSKECRYKPSSAGFFDPSGNPKLAGVLSIRFFFKPAVLLPV